MEGGVAFGRVEVTSVGVASVYYKKIERDFLYKP
jgi:hypothetical protein